MKIQTGYIYHIKDSFFKKVNSKGLMINHENGHARPTYFTIRDNNILWFIPLSSKIEKYKNIINKKILFWLKRDYEFRKSDFKKRFN